MGGTTTKYALPYPVGADTPDVPRDMLALANAVDGIFIGSDVVTAAGTRIISNKLAGADTQPSFRIMGDGKIQWGPGGTTALDTNLYRSSTNVLRTDGQLVTGNGLYSVAGAVRSDGAAAGTITFASAVPGDTFLRYTVTADGKQYWGPGNVAADTFLYRGTTNLLRTDGSLYVGLDIAAQYNLASQVLLSNRGGNATILFGSGQDTNLYRAGANSLKTDGAFTAVGAVALGWDGATSGWAIQIPASTTSAIITGAPLQVLGWLQSTSIIYGSGVITQSGDAAKQIQLASNGQLYFGSANDISLYRESAGTLHVSGNLNTDAKIQSSQSAASAIAFQAGSLASGGYAFISKQGADASWRTIIDATGAISFGDGTSWPDTYISRNGATSLVTNAGFTAASFATNGSLTANGGVVFGNEMYRSNALWFVDVTGKLQWGPGDWSRDTNLYRPAAGQLQTDGQFNAQGGVRTIRPAVNWMLFNYLLLADTQPAFVINGDGALHWGPGGTTALDTNLYRGGANYLATDGSLQVGVNLVMPGGWLYLRKVDARINFGTADDVNLYRFGAGYLKTDQSFVAGQELFVDYGNAGKKLYFGSAADTNLYRSAAGVLKSDGRFQAASVSVQSGTANEITLWDNGKILFGSASDTNLYRSGAGVLKTDGTLLVVSNVQAQGHLMAVTDSGRVYFGAAADTSLYRSAANIIKTDGYIVQSNQGTSFPSSPVDGQEYNYIADATNGVVWKFIYNSSATKWRFVGGPPLASKIDTAESTTSNTYADLTTVGPSIALPFAGDYDVEICAQIAPGAQNELASMSYACGATAAIDNDRASYQAPPTGGTPAGYDTRGFRSRKTGISGTVTAKYRVANATTTNFRYRTIMIWPVQK